MKQYFKCKSPKEIEELMYIQPILGFVFFDMVAYCDSKGLPVVVTCVNRTLEENKAVGAVSLTHVEGRAIDLSIKGWTIEQITEFCQYFNKKYIKFANPVALYHTGTAPHIHVQIFRLA